MALRLRAFQQLEQTFYQLEQPISEISIPQVNMTVGGPDCGNSHWYRFEVVTSANQAGKYANFSENYYFVKVSSALVGNDSYSLLLFIM